MFSGIAPGMISSIVCSAPAGCGLATEFVKGIGLASQATVLDLAAGTLDVSLEIIRQKPSSQMVAADFSLAMLFKGKEKLKLARVERSIFPVAADAYALPFTETRSTPLPLPSYSQPTGSNYCFKRNAQGNEARRNCGYFGIHSTG